MADDVSVEAEIAAVAEGRKPISLSVVEVGDGREEAIRAIAARFELPVVIGEIDEHLYRVGVARSNEQWRMLADEVIGRADPRLHALGRSVILGYTPAEIAAHVAHRRALGRIVVICPEEELEKIAICGMRAVHPGCDLSRFVLVGAPARLRLRADAPARLAPGDVLLTVAITHELERTLWGAMWLELIVLAPPPKHLTVEVFNRNITENFERVVE